MIPTLHRASVDEIVLDTLREVSVRARALGLDVDVGVVRLPDQTVRVTVAEAVHDVSSTRDFELPSDPGRLVAFVEMVCRWAWEQVTARPALLGLL